MAGAGRTSGRGGVAAAGPGGTGVGVTPYWELTFDADGDVLARQRDALLAGVERERVTDLVVFSHGWNNDRSIATRLYSRFFEPFPGLVGRGVRLGYVGVLWPAMRFTDEPIPDFPPSALGPSGRGPGAVSGRGPGAVGGEPEAGTPGTPGTPGSDAGGSDASRFDAAGFDASGAARGPRSPGEPPRAPELDDATRQTLAAVFPGRELALGRLAELLHERPDARSAFDEFARLVREVVSVGPESPDLRFAEDSGHGGPAMLEDDALEVCQIFTAGLRDTGVALWPAEPAEEIREPLFGGLTRWWNGAHEMLRQGSYYGMKRRSGTVGQLGLGPVLGRLAVALPRLRIHLVGHSFGARLVSYALRGLPRNVAVTSVTLLQGAFSHYAFAERLPHDPSRGGALMGAQHRINGPLVSCHSEHDTALGRLYPLASKLAGDSASFLGLFDRWGAIGFTGILGVEGARRIRLGQAIPEAGCVSVDASSVVRRGLPPAGAHSDICHEELARVVLDAGRVTRG